MRIAPLCGEHTFVALALKRKGDIEGSAKVDTNEGTTSEWLGLPCTVTDCPPKPGPAAKKLAAELASDGKALGTPTENDGVSQLGFTAEKIGEDVTIAAALEEARSATRAA